MASKGLCCSVGQSPSQAALGGSSSTTCRHRSASNQSPTTLLRLHSPAPRRKKKKKKIRPIKKKMAVDLEAFSSKGGYRKPLQSPRSLFPEARRSPTPCSITQGRAGGSTHGCPPPTGPRLSCPSIPTGPRLHPAESAATSLQVSIPPCLCGLLFPP